MLEAELQKCKRSSDTGVYAMGAYAGGAAAATGVMVKALTGDACSGLVICCIRRS